MDRGCQWKDTAASHTDDHNGEHILRTAVSGLVAQCCQQRADDRINDHGAGNEVGEQNCQKDVTKVSHFEAAMRQLHDAVTHTIHHEAEGYYKTVHHDAVTHTELHFICNKCGADMGTTNGSINAHIDYHANLGEAIGYGEREVTVTDKAAYDEQVWVETKAAWDETIVDKEAWDEQVKVVDKEAWDEQVKVVDKKAWTETIVIKEAWDEQVKVVDKEAWVEENVYIVDEPAVTKEVWVVDKEAVYEQKWHIDKEAWQENVWVETKPAVREDVYVVDKEAWTETIIKNVCSECGAVQ